jgi:hypothetical protein
MITMVIAGSAQIYAEDQVRRESRKAAATKIQQWWRKAKGIARYSESTGHIRLAEHRMSLWMSYARSLVDRNAHDRKKCYRCEKMFKGLDFKRHTGAGGRHYFNSLNWENYKLVPNQEGIFYCSRTAKAMGSDPTNWVFDKTGAIAGTVVWVWGQTRSLEKFSCLRCKHEHAYDESAFYRQRENEKRSASIIQRAWRRARDDPDYWMCKKILLGGLMELGAITEEDYAKAMGFTPTNELPPLAV